MIVAVLGEKGGVGKTTFATNLAGMRSKVSDVMLLDSDRQGSSTIWVENRAGLNREELSSPETMQSFGQSVGRAIVNMNRRYEDVVVDVASGDSVAIERILSVANVAIIPVQPSGVDLWTLGLLDQRVEETLLGNPALSAVAVINRASPNPQVKDAVAVRETMLNENQAITVADVVVRDRVAVKRALAAGLTVLEHDSRNEKARWEMEALYEVAFGAEAAKEVAA